MTGVVDLTRPGGGPARLLDVVADRSASALVSWISKRDPGWGTAVTTAALDPYRGYASALRAALPHAVRVLDAFHGTRLGFAAVDDVRRRIQQAQTGHRGRSGDPLFGIRRLLRRAHTHHSQRSWTRLLAGLDAGDTTDEQLARTWIAAQDLRLIYHARDRGRAEEIQANAFAAALLMPDEPVQAAVDRELAIGIDSRDELIQGPSFRCSRSASTPAW